MADAKTTTYYTNNGSTAYMDTLEKIHYTDSYKTTTDGNATTTSSVVAGNSGDIIVAATKKSSTSALKKSIKVKVKLDATLFVIDRQALVKTYCSKIVLKQWFTDAGVKKTQTKYYIPKDEVGEQVTKTSFVLEDFGKIVFTTKKSALKKFNALKKYAKDNKTGEEQPGETPSEGGEQTVYPDEGEIQYYTPVLPELPDRTPKEDERYYDPVYPTPKIPDPAPKPGDDYIKVESEPDIPDKDEYIPEEQKQEESYYDETGKRVYPTGGFISAKGDIIKVRYYDSEGNTIYHKGAYLGRGTYVYEDGRIVPKHVKVLRYMELYGNASVKDGLQTTAVLDEEVPTQIDVDTSTEIGD